MSDPEPTPIEYASPAPDVRPPGERSRAALYLVLGNVWLLVALAVYVGRTLERGRPAMYSVYGVGRWFTPSEYEFLVLGPAILGIALTSLAIRQAWKLRRAQ